MYAHKPTSGISLPAASLTYASELKFLAGLRLGLTIHEPLRPAKDAAIHTPIHGDSKSLPK